MTQGSGHASCREVAVESVLSWDASFLHDSSLPTVFPVSHMWVLGRARVLSSLIMEQ